MANGRDTLKQVGITLVVIGVMDIVLMIYCIATEKNYSSSLNIFAVVAGIFLIRGSLAAVRVVTWFLAFLLTGLLGAAIFLLPMTLSLDLLLTQIRLNQFGPTLVAIATFAVLGVLAWCYWRLRSPEVLQAREEAGRSTSPPYLAFVVGAAFIVMMTLLMSAVMNDQDRQRAIALASEREGPGYKYQLTSIRRTNNKYSATVTAYNDKEIKLVDVRWEQ